MKKEAIAVDPILEPRLHITFQQIAILQTKTGYTFKNRKYLETALTHPSFLHKDQRIESNERLEFLGDKILGCFVALALFREFPRSSEGALTQLTSELVSNRVLAEIAQDVGLDSQILIGEVEIKHLQNGRRSRERVLACSFEALVGAIYLDGGDKAIQSFVQTFFPAKVRNALARGPKVHPKNQLQEFVAERLKATLYYRTKSRWVKGAKEFTVGVYVKNNLLGEGVGRSKREASLRAAKNALNALMFDRGVS